MVCLLRDSNLHLQNQPALPTELFITPLQTLILFLVDIPRTIYITTIMYIPIKIRVRVAMACFFDLGSRAQGILISLSTLGRASLVGWLRH